MQDTFLPLTNVNGVVNFDKYDSDYNVTGFVRNSKVHVVGTGNNSQIDLKAYSDKFKLADIFDYRIKKNLVKFIHLSKLHIRDVQKPEILIIIS